MAFLPEGIATKYRGYVLLVSCEDIMCVAPNGDIACFYSPARARLWVRRHRASHARKGEGVMSEYGGAAFSPGAAVLAKPDVVSGGAGVLTGSPS